MQDPVSFLGSSPPPLRKVPNGDRKTAGSAGKNKPADGTASGQDVPVHTSRERSVFTLRRVTLLLLVLLVAQYLVPYLLERYQYSITRGKQRAEYESAAEAMGHLQLSTLSKAFRLVSHRVGPSVVHIDVSPLVREQDLTEPPHGFDRSPTLPGQGSGVIVDDGGYILTNNHVVEEAVDIRVSLSDGRLFPAVIVGQDPPTDLALLKIDADDLVAAEWGDSREMEVGELVWAVGSPFGLQRTVTFGIVSGKHRAGMAGGAYQDFLQTDAAVNPGNSGGPLVDSQGRIVGINTAILGDVYQGISFAIPTSIARDIYDRLLTDGQVARGWLGVRLRDVDNNDVRLRGLPNATGTMIDEVLDSPDYASPAREIGLRVGDVIVQWNDEPVQSTVDLVRFVAMTEIGSTAEIAVYRGSERLRLHLTVAKRPLE